MRRSRLVGRDYKFLAPEMENLFSPTSNAIGVKLWAALVQSSQGELGLWAVDVKDAYPMVPQEEKVYVERNEEFFELGRCLPGQRVGSKAWYDHLGKVARDQGLQPYPANLAVFYKAGRTPLVMSSHVDDLRLVGSQQDVEKLLDRFRKQEWTLQVQGPMRALLKRHVA